jgi:putative transposase
MTDLDDRQKLVTLIAQACHSGASLDAACQAAGISLRTYQRWNDGGKLSADSRPDAKRAVPANKLSEAERKQILDTCCQPEFASLPPSQIVPRLADQGQYLASESSFYRVLHQANQQHHRGRSRKPRNLKPPQGFVAQAPNQVWTWDITWLAAGVRGMYFYLYMIVDVFSRMIVCWEVHDCESAEHAATLVEQTVWAQGCVLNPPVLHADNGSAQKGFTLKAKLEALGVTPSYSRPQVSDDNPYSEALFRTVKYRPDYPVKGFADIQAARSWVAAFVAWYNYVHRHSAIKFVTPAQRHQGDDQHILSNRQQLYQHARQQHPERWSGQIRNWDPAGPVWLNPPKDNKSIQEIEAGNDKAVVNPILKDRDCAAA